MCPTTSTEKPAHTNRTLKPLLCISR